MTPAIRAELFVAAPKTFQAVVAALGDYYTWQLARRVFGQDSYQSWATLTLTVLSPWQWFCSTRTLSNCLETTLTIVALHNWPWQWSLTDQYHARYDDTGLRMREDDGQEVVDETTRLRRSLLLAALATILRPTNLLIWMSLVAMTCLKMSSAGWLANLPWFDRAVLIEVTHPSFIRATTRERRKLIVDSVLCGSTILILSVLVDRFFYHFWTFPPLRFIYFNLVQSLAVFYGRNDWHYYLSQGIPLLLTTALPFATAGLYMAFFSTDMSKAILRDTITAQLATIACIVPAALSLISHKEVRFIYPLLPLLHILAAEPLTRFFAPSLIYPLRSRRTPPHTLLKRLVLGLLILLNATIGIYTTTVHGRGAVDVLSYLRHEHEKYYITKSNAKLTAAFLMPCHSTPWRSHLVHHDICSWALTCEPPIHLSEEEKLTYLDEADIFYADPLLWLRHNMSRQPPHPRAGVFTRDKRLEPHAGRQKLDHQGHHVDTRREWPDYLIFFAQAERIMDVALRGSGYTECWRGFNSHWHDDWRRQGDVVAWCLFPERRVKKDEQEKVRVHLKRDLGSLWQGTIERTMDWPGKMKQAFQGSRLEHSENQKHEKRSSGQIPTIFPTEEHSDNILGGAKGPWGVGVGKSNSKEQEPRSPWWQLSALWGHTDGSSSAKKKPVKARMPGGNKNGMDLRLNKSTTLTLHNQICVNVITILD